MVRLSGSGTAPGGESTSRSQAAVVEYHLRGLGSDDLAALVADLWASRGYETSREGWLVVATRGRETVRVAVAGRRRLGTPSLPDRPLDVVVAPGAVTAESVAGDPRILDAGDLRELLFYAVDRPTSRQLCERHLGGPPERLRPSLPTRLRNRSWTAASWVTPAVALAFFLLVGLGAVATVAFTPDGGEHREHSPGQAGTSVVPMADPGIPATSESANRSTVAPPYSVLATASAGAAESDESETVGFVGTLRSPPGVTDEGVANLTTLASAHERVVTERSYTLRLERVQPVNPLWEQDTREIEVAVDGDRYLLTERRVLPDGRVPVREVYDNGSALWVAGFTENGTVEAVRQTQAGNSSERPGPDPFELQETLLRRYLSTPETAVTDRLPRGDRTVTRIAARGRPAGVGSEAIRNYSAVALVDDRGFVRNLTVEYTIATGPPNFTVRFEVRYGNLDETDVRAPRWHGRAFPSIRGPVRVERSRRPFGAKAPG